MSRLLGEVVPEFLSIAHSIVWCSVASVGPSGRPRSRVLHPYWEWDGTTLVGWIATMPTRLKRTHLDYNPYVSCSYWAPTHDAAVAECRTELIMDDAVRTRVWNLFKSAPPPLGYDPGAINVPGWDSPTSTAFAAMRLEPWRLKALPATIFFKAGSGGALVWRA